MVLSAGTRLGPYEILSPLGAGGMGEVYRAEDARLGREVAIKVLPERFLDGKERKQRFEREARLLATLNHPGIAAIYSFEEVPGSPSPSESPSRHLLVMELLEGETLRERLRRAGPLPPRRAIDAAAQMAKGLAAAHEKGILHRDLKPENVFLTKDARVKILDFGLAKFSQCEQALEMITEPGTLTLQTEAGAVFGTAGYMSPEQVRGEPLDFRSDLFSFGTILHEMLSGRNPFRRSTQAETLTAILREEPTPVSESAIEMPPALSSIVGRCLEKEPDMRFHSAADLAFALETLAPASSSAATPSQRSVETRPRRALVLAVVLVSLATAVAGAFLAGKRAGVTPAPSFQRLTFRRGYVDTARFAPDGQTVIFAAAWDGTPIQLYATRKGSPETTPLGSPETLLLGVSSKGELALSLRPAFVAFSWLGMLARAPLAGGASREVLNDVQEADWSPDGSSLAVVRASMEGHSRLEFPLGTILLESRGRLAQPRISRDGRLIALLDHTGIEDLDGSVVVVDRKGQKRILSSGWATARGLAWSPRGDEVWFTASKSGRAQALWAVNLSGGERLVSRWGGSWNLHDVLPDGRVLLTLGSLESSMVGTTPAGERNLSWLDSSIAHDISADGNLVLFDETGEGVGGRHVVYVRRLDGAPALRLGEGSAAALSPDGRWALVYRAQPLSSLVVIPTGAGEDKVLPRGTIAEYDVEKFMYAATFFPGGKRVVFRGAESGKPHRLFLQDVEGGLPRPFGEDSLLIPLVSPDGRWIAAYSPTFTEKVGALLSEKAGALLIYTSDGQLAQKVALERGEAPIRWGQDSRSLYLRQRENMLVRVFRLDLQSGQRQLWREVKPHDPAGFLRGTYTINISSDGESIVCTYLRGLTDLYLVEGLK